MNSKKNKEAGIKITDVELIDEDYIQEAFEEEEE